MPNNDDTIKCPQCERVVPFLVGYGGCAACVGFTVPKPRDRWHDGFEDAIAVVAERRDALPDLAGGFSPLRSILDETLSWLRELRE